MKPFVKELEEAFGTIGIKNVTANDISKGAYVVNGEQKAVLQTAGKHPGVMPDVEIVSLHVLNSTKVLSASYYDSIRAGSGRDPETRMGRELVSWVSEGDRLLMATDGRDVFVHKLTAADYQPPQDPVTHDEKVIGALSQIDREKLLMRAKSANPRPRQDRTEAPLYARDPAVRAWAMVRSDFRCEVPGCGCYGFLKADGRRYIETHHIVPLGENGEDTIANTAAVCPNCHRKAHYSTERTQMAENLRQAVGDGT